MYTVSQVKEIFADGNLKVGCETVACQGCKCSMFCNNKNDTDYMVLNPNKVQVEIGDFVELYMPPGRTVLSTALVFAMPLVFFPIGYIVGKVLLPQSNEIIHALSGFAAMVLSFGIASLITLKHKNSLMPCVTKVVRQ